MHTLTGEPCTLRCPWVTGRRGGAGLSSDELRDLSLHKAVELCAMETRPLECIFVPPPPARTLSGGRDACCSSRPETFATRRLPTQPTSALSSPVHQHSPTFRTNAQKSPVAEFAAGQAVKWSISDADIPKGAVGKIRKPGSSAGYYEVKFPRGVFEIPATQLRHSRPARPVSPVGSLDSDSVAEKPHQPSAPALAAVEVLPVRAPAPSALDKSVADSAMDNIDLHVDTRGYLACFPGYKPLSIHASSHHTLGDRRKEVDFTVYRDDVLSQSLRGSTMKGSRSPSYM